MFLFLRPVFSVRNSKVKNKPRAQFATPIRQLLWAWDNAGCSQETGKAFFLAKQTVGWSRQKINRWAKE